MHDFPDDEIELEKRGGYQPLNEDAYKPSTALNTSNPPKQSGVQNNKKKD